MEVVLLNFREHFPNAERLGCSPSLRITAPLLMRSVAIENFGNVTGATLIQQTFHAPQISARRCHGFRLKLPGAGESLAEIWKGPRPGRAIMISRFASRILVAFVTAPVRFIGIV